MLCKKHFIITSLNNVDIMDNCSLVSQVFFVMEICFINTSFVQLYFCSSDVIVRNVNVKLRIRGDNDGWVFVSGDII